MISSNSHLLRLGLHRPLRSSSPSPLRRPSIAPAPPRSASFTKPYQSQILRCGCGVSKRFSHPVAVMDDDSVAIPSLFDEGEDDSGWNSYYPSSSDGDEGDFDMFVNVNAEVDLPTTRREHMETPDPALTVTAHRFASIQRGHRGSRIAAVLVNTGLIAFLAFFLLFIDWCSWRIVRLPLEPFYLTRPFSISAVLSACAGCLYVPIADSMKIHRIFRKRNSVLQSSKRVIPTMGGLFFIPIGITVARGLAGLHSNEVYGATVATLALAATGLLDDILYYRGNNNYKLLGWMKFVLQIALGTWFSYWLDSTDISTPYSMKWLMPLPPPVGLVYLGKFYLVLSTFSFAAMGNGVKLTDGLDGLAGGAAALAFTGMSVAVLAICPDLALFGASMAGACIGFLFHNSYKASVYMGCIGYFALGGALAAMASCTGMFFPLVISSGVFVLEVLSILVQVFLKKVTRRNYPAARPLFRIAPLYQHLLLYGLTEPVVVAIEYAVSCILAISAGYVGLISA